MQLKQTLRYIMISCVLLLSVSMLSINIQAQAPQKAQIAFTSERDGIGRHEIYVMDADGSNQRRLTNNPASGNASSAWSPDGQKIAFYSLRDGNREIYVMDADGSNQRRVTNNPAGDWYPSWSPDGQRIVFSAYPKPGLLEAEIYVIDVDGKNQRNLANHPAHDAGPEWFDPAFARSAFVSPASKLKGTWGEIRLGRELCQIDAKMFCILRQFQ